ncbi:RNA replicase [Sphingosinicella sp. CPCC 101087]|uniref:RNA replicase n=1 Tax=Sphingosinicella sp. CPCC 101087 TaxID=2497754 RepID=UPI00101CE6B4|nr:RNA replicase [Sphingosinicella sp. CPCC 101087]
MSAPFGTIAGCAPKKRTGQRVWRNSYHRGEREHRIWRPLGKTREEAWKFKRALLKAAERFEDLTKPAGRRMGELGWTGVKVLKALIEIVDNMTGRLEPAIATIAAKANLGVSTVGRALARLRDAGFLDWLRRTEPLDNDGAGPQVHQTSNAYWFRLRGRAAGLVRLILGKAPPESKSREEVQAEASAERAARLKAMRGPARVSAADVLTDEAKASLRRLKEMRSANALKPMNPGSKG